MSDWISTKEVMSILGVGSTTIKRWADESKLPSIRTAGGHRRFRRAAVERILGCPDVDSGDSEALDNWVNWLGTNDAHRICDRIKQLRQASVDWFSVANYLGEVAAEIGRCWEDGQYSIVDEHIATAKLAQALASISSAFRVQLEAPVCLLATLSGEQHTLGLSLTQLCMRSIGINALWVGADVPAADLARHIEESEQQLVALSASRWQTDHRTLAKDFNVVAKACQKSNVDLILGGQGAWPDVIYYGDRCYTFDDLTNVLANLMLPPSTVFESE